MELFLLKNEFGFLKPVLRKTETKEVGIDVVVSDSMPDVDSIISVTAVPMMREKEAFLGKMNVSGVCDVAVFYESGEAENTQKLSTSIEFSNTFEAPEINTDSLLSAKITVTNADARTINSRKVSIKLELKYEVEAYNRETASVPYSVTGSETVELLTSKKTICCASGLSEKVFSVTDSIPADGEITVGDVDFTVEDVKIVDTKAVIKGIAITTLLIGEEEKRVESPFSQVIDLETDSEPKAVDCTIMPSGVYASERIDAESGAGEADIELSLVCQCRSMGEIQIEYIADAYSTKGNLEIMKEKLGISDDESMSYITSLVETEADAPKMTHSVILCRANDTESLWSIAKRYAARKSLVMEANGMETEEIKPGSIILVPKN
ncbi:MAG: DUF3794 domain-containing protein [Oscillospiraceae bacterium]|nr:DUF3794 domain-containing protein [Oscillospiraceae bacterium]